jgi:uncharacterized protein (TIGR00369 family)
MTLTSLFGEEPIHEEPGLARWRYRVKREHFNPGGSLHGGVISTILDTAMGHSVRTVRPPDCGHAAIDLNVKFLRPTLEDGALLTFEGRVVQKGKRIVFSEGSATDEEGRLLARSTSSYAILPKKAGSLSSS